MKRLGHGPIILKKMVSGGIADIGPHSNPPSAPTIGGMGTKNTDFMLITCFQ
jgi:hypothetical protein